MLTEVSSANEVEAALFCALLSEAKDLGLRRHPFTQFSAAEAAVWDSFTFRRKPVPGFCVRAAVLHNPFAHALPNGD
ncbi:MAG TPA: hypothetical protein VJ728_04295 [Candidatus Binataceae bacterium]|nr:hypothetical protein [Candidatus Binataceae bacterium]